MMAAVKNNNESGGYRLFALCAVGAEKVLTNELRKNTEAVFNIIETGFGKVVFSTDLRGIYAALMGLRTADRILLELTSFNAGDFDELFEGVKAVPLEDFVPGNTSIVISKVRTNRSQLKAETSIQSIVHKAAADRLCAAYKTVAAGDS